MTTWGPSYPGAVLRTGSRRTEPLVAPYDGRVLGEVEQADDDDVGAAVAAAGSAYRTNRKTPGHQRAGWLHAAANRMEQATDELVTMLVDALGKPRKASEFEARRGPALLHLCAEEISRMGGQELRLDGVPGGEGRWGMTRREPFGVVGAITPFNAPINLLLQKVAPAIAMGNAIVVKPAHEGATIALRLAELWEDILPPGLFSVLPGDAAAARAIAAHPDVRAVSLTGGTAAGESVLRVAGIKPVNLELGSNAPNIVCADADLGAAAVAIAGAAFAASGQQCISAQRVIVERGAFDEFAERFVAAAAALSVGDPADGSVDLGPVVNGRARDRVLEHIADAERRGGKVLLDGRPDDASSLLIGPTIVGDVPPDSRLTSEEVFGPVAVLILADDVDHALSLANACDLGLQASCFTSSLATAMTVAEELQAGSVWINEPTRFRLDTYPFGGYRHSGIGREGVRYAMEAFSQLKFIGLRP